VIYHDDSTILVCADCGEDIETISAGDEGWNFCPGCRNVEGPTKTMYIDDNGEYTIEEKDIK
jgi:hypothetical protein